MVVSAALAFAVTVASLVGAVSGSQPLVPETARGHPPADAPRPEQMVTRRTKYIVMQPTPLIPGTAAQRAAAANLSYGTHVYDIITREQDVLRILPQRGALSELLRSTSGERSTAERWMSLAGAGGVGLLTNAVLRPQRSDGWSVELGRTIEITRSELRAILPNHATAFTGKAEDNFPDKFKPLSPPTQQARIWTEEPRSDLWSSRDEVRCQADGRAALLFVENRRAFGVHLFHFCETLLLAHAAAHQMLKGGADDVGCIAFPNF